jgi:hypothetical protein
MNPRPAVRWKRWLLVACAATATATGCGGSFDPYNRLNSIRVLALRSDPVRPTVGETSKLSAMIYTPNEIAPASFEWSWCPVTTAAGADCPFSSAQLTEMAQVPINLELGSTPEASFVHNIPPALLTTLCAGAPNFPAPDCADGYPIQLRLKVCTDADPASCHDTDHAVEAVRPMRLRFRDSDQANANPTIDSLYAIVGGASQPLDPASLPPLKRHQETVIGANINIDQDSEPYRGKDDSGAAADVFERLNLSWFVESGDTDHMRTAYIKGQVTVEDATRIKWTPAYQKDEKNSRRADHDRAKVVVIIRDDRDGVGWAQGAATLEPAP